MPRLISAIEIQQINPSRIGFPPDLINLIKLVLSPIAPIAIVMKNFPAVVKNADRFASAKTEDNTVFTAESTSPRPRNVFKTDANKKNKTNQGNIFANCTLLPAVRSSFFERQIASTRVIGIIASVRVSFTIVA